MRIRWKLPLVFALSMLVFAGIVAFTAAVTLPGVFLDRLEDDMSRQARQYAATLDVLELTAAATTDLTPDKTTAALQQLTEKIGEAADARFTLIDSQGRVLADSKADPSALGNHADRPEIKQALAGNEGRERRYSATLGEEEVYVAIPLPAGQAGWSGGAVRVAQPASRIDSMVAATWQIPLIVWVALLLPTVVVAYFLTRSITRPLEQLRQMAGRVASGEFSHGTSIRRKDELGELEKSFNNMAAELDARSRELRSEVERSSQVLNAMSDGVLLMGPDGHLLESNPAAELILETSLRSSLGAPLVFAARSFPAQALADKAYSAGHALTEALELPNGRCLTVEVIPLQAPGLTADRPPGPALGGRTLFILRDETARRATERMRRDFVTNVSHELKTPLAGLSLLAQTLATAVRDDPEQAAKFVARLSAEIGRLVDLTDDLLTLSQLEDPEAGSAGELVPIDLATLVVDTVNELKAQAEAKGHDLTLETSGRLIIRGDDVAVRTLIRNLLDNAIRYTEREGHISIRLAAEDEANDQKWAVLTVKDDGVGISLADQGRVFERFYRVDKARSRDTGGTGLGLSIVRHVVERHQGRVTLQSTLGVGSTFTVHLPRLFP